MNFPTNQDELTNQILLAEKKAKGMDGDRVVAIRVSKVSKRSGKSYYWLQFS